jgi:hypothetical protein
MVAALAGPKILLLLPIWVLGAALYWHRPVVGERTALALLLASTVAALLLVYFDVGTMIRGWMFAHWPSLIRPLQGSNQFVGDWLLAIPVALNFAAAGSLGRFGRPLLRLAVPIRAAAGCTLSAYLYHVPLKVLVIRVLGIQSWPGLLAIVACVWCLAQVTERQLSLARRLLSGGPRARWRWFREHLADLDAAKPPSGRRSAIDGRTTRHAGYAISIRNRIAKVFGWMKTG